MCFMSEINSQNSSNMHANKQLVNSENWSITYNVTQISTAYISNLSIILSDSEV